jgi:translation elongation factor P/translation initiation factor 5A
MKKYQYRIVKVRRSKNGRAAHIRKIRIVEKKKKSKNYKVRSLSKKDYDRLYNDDYFDKLADNGAYSPYETKLMREGTFHKAWKELKRKK